MAKDHLPNEKKRPKTLAELAAAGYINARDAAASLRDAATTIEQCHTGDVVKFSLTTWFKPRPAGDD